MNINYEFQHRLLPDWSYNAPKFFNDLVNEGEKQTLYKAIKSVYDNRKVECPYREDDFSGFHTRLDVDTVAIVLRFPQPEEVPLCYCGLIFLDTNTNRIGYYTMEKGKDPITGQDMQFLCGWGIDGQHQQYGSVYTEKMNFGDIFLIRFFYSVFRNLKNARIPDQLKEENECTSVLQCPACKNQIIFDASKIEDGDVLIIFCPACGRIYELRYRNNEYLIENKIQQK